MTKKLAESLGLASPEDLGIPEDELVDEIVSENEESRDVVEVLEEAKAIKEDLSTAQKIDEALSSVEDLAKHDVEMDEIAAKALQSYQDLCDMSMNMTDNYVARLYEVSATMLKVALDARDSKNARRMKTLELQMKKLKMDRDNGEDDGNNGGSGAQFNRNELLEILKGNSDDKK